MSDIFQDFRTIPQKCDFHETAVEVLNALGKTQKISVEIYQTSGEFRESSKKFQKLQRNFNVEGFRKAWMFPGLKISERFEEFHQTLSDVSEIP